MDPSDDHTMFHLPLPLDVAREVIAYARGRDVHVNVYLEDNLYMAEDTEPGRTYARIAGVDVHVVGDLHTFLTKPPTKLVLVSDERTTTAMVEELAKRVGRRAHITRSYPLFCEAIHPEVSKGRALTELAARLGIPNEQVMAIGDNWNDLEICGRRYAWPWRPAEE